jgi:hypothetical protein
MLGLFLAVFLVFNPETGAEIGEFHTARYMTHEDCLAALVNDHDHVQAMAELAIGYTPRLEGKCVPKEEGI